MPLKLGLIGYPINHSLSPWIHNEFMQRLGIEGEYLLYEVPEANLGTMINHIKEMKLNGFNVTVPYKQAIIPYLDFLDSDAEKIGAVNTVVNENGKWKGYNTDGQGYIRSVKMSFPDLFGASKKVLLLGAGGAARGIYRALTHEPFERIDIANRTGERARSLLDVKEDRVETSILSFQEAEQQLFNYDFIVQTTSVGMKPNVADQVISLENLKENTVVSDIIYQPILTSFLKNAQRQNGRTHLGHAMLLYQAQLAFQIWTGKTVPLDRTLSKLEQRLRGNE
ncbi:shikimate dehydrogenase [Aquibacillus halophilus]|uniref:Shikimate dehydrogenase (NADP(+)) n=1 Tax=Aquibacillus halophilus TaxID=930132 RepID=A0A6A8DBH5_9BACI|nr:shikimate dehydrogenase [Aquibacillus halophilus]MRH43053.1 shikimate dehydrogenase [Aquibacillus halophilus]